MRDNSMSNYIFRSYEDILDDLCCVLNRLVDIPDDNIFRNQRQGL